MPDAPELLRPASFHILLALAEAPLHGLGIADEVERITGGAVVLGPGTLYRSLKDLATDGLIADARPPEAADPRRRYYRMTAVGRRRLAYEARMLAQVVRVARARDVLPEGA